MTGGEIHWAMAMAQRLRSENPGFDNRTPAQVIAGHLRKRHGVPNEIVNAVADHSMIALAEFHDADHESPLWNTHE